MNKFDLNPEMHPHSIGETDTEKIENWKRGIPYNWEDRHKSIVVDAYLHAKIDGIQRNKGLLWIFLFLTFLIWLFA